MKTYTIEHGFLMEAYNSACNDWKVKIKDKFPDAFKSELEVGKWYKNKHHSDLIFISEIDKEDKVKYYGFYYGEFKDERNTEIHYGYGKDSENWTLATEQEVKEALIKEAEKRGFKEGAAMISMNGHGKCYLYVRGTISYTNNRFKYMGCEIFKDGNWATPIKETEVTLTQLTEFYKQSKGIDNLKVV